MTPTGSGCHDIIGGRKPIPGMQKKEFRSLFFSTLLMLGVGAGLLNGAGVRAAANQAVAHDHLLISEFRTRGPSGVQDEFIEIFNPTNSPIVTTNWEIEISDSSGAIIATLHPFPDPTVLQSGQHYLVASSNWSGAGGLTPDATYNQDIPDNGGIALSSSGIRVDQVGMSPAPTPQEGTPLPPLSGNQDQSYERGPADLYWNCTDSNDNLNDFHLLSPSNPQNSSSPYTSACIGPGQTINFTSSTPVNARVAGATYVPAAMASSGLPVALAVDPSAAAVCTLSAGVVSFNTAGTCRLNASQGGDDYYTAAPTVQQSFTVGKGDQTVNFTTSAPADARVGGAGYTPSATASSGLTVGLGIDPLASAVCSMNAGTVSFLAAGICTINATQPGDGNYNPAPMVQQSFTVNKGNQVITFTSSAPANALVGGPTYTPIASASSGMAVTFSIDPSSSAVCALNAGVISFTANGTCSLNANQAGDARYNAAAQVQQSFTVGLSATATPSAPEHIVISEFRSLGPDGAEDEFVELFNPSGGAVNIGGWSIKRSSSCGTSLATLLTTPANLILAAGQHYLAAASGSSITNMDQTFTAGLADDGGLALVNASGVIVDLVGMCTGTTYVESSILPPLTGSADQSYERKPGGPSSCYDTNNNRNDFTLISPATPRNRASSISMCPGVLIYTPSFTPTRTLSPTPSRTPTFMPGTVVLNEFLPHPRSDWNGDGSANTSDEYIELINMGTNSINLNNWKLDNGAGGSGTFTITKLTLMPKQVIVLFRSETGIPLSDAGGLIRLVRPDGITADIKDYPAVGAPEQSWCRLPDGVGAWGFSCLPTPGSGNTALQSATPTPSSNPGTGKPASAPVCNLPGVPEGIRRAECGDTSPGLWSQVPAGEIWLGSTGKYGVFVE